MDFFFLIYLVLFILAYLWINIDHNQLQKFYNISDLNLLNCHYKPFIRVNDSATLKSDKRVQLSFGEKYLISDEFIQVQCVYGLKNHSEYHSFLPKKPKVIERVQKKIFYNSEMNQEEKLNVMILGIDTLSRLNFHRTMKKSCKTLYKLGGIELFGYNKVGKL